MKAWEIPATIEIIKEQMVDPSTGECLTDEEVKELCDGLEVEFEEKIKYLCKLVQNEKDSAEIYKAHKDDFAKKQKSAENRAEAIKKYIAMVLNGNKWEADDKSVCVQFRTTKDVVKIDSVEDVPLEFFKTQLVEKNINKTAIKAMLKSGVNVPGAHLGETISTIIK